MDDQTPSRDKREQLVDSLIGSREYVELLVEQVGRPAPVQPQDAGREGRLGASASGSASRSRTNKPYDRFVRELITAQGSNLDATRRSTTTARSRTRRRRR